ncbi:MAG: hypothetical protein JNK61_09445 [Bacteroidia bacterium]|nr:hypothetical protein [Bacteroidia bacterium]
MKTKFNYWQCAVSWFITGENRKYNKQNGNVGKLIPNKNFTFRNGGGLGAIELATRITVSDFNMAQIAGGTFTRFTAALNWFPNAHLR